MSMPTFPDGLDITQEQAFNMILGSIAMEELALSHIINAEAEKLQYVLGTLPGHPGCCATPQDLLRVNKSVSDLLERVQDNQLLLKGKMERALEAKEKWCPPAPPFCRPDHCAAGQLARAHTACTYHAQPNQVWRAGCALPWLSGASVCAQPPAAASACVRLFAPYTYLIAYQFVVCAEQDCPVSIALQNAEMPAQTYATCQAEGCPHAPICLSGSTLFAPARCTCSSAPVVWVLCAPESVVVQCATLQCFIL